MVKIFFFFLTLVCIAACSDHEKIGNTDIKDVAGNDEVLNFMKTFEGRGDLSDSSKMIPPEQAVSQFTIPKDLALDLVLSEPKITQPVFITFDMQGRLWVVQYIQYPYPQGLKVLSMDQHTRATFDKEPLPPPSNERGADKITMFEDTDGNGTFDKSTDVISGLNLVTSVAFGRGQIWVLNPPYLIAYPDPDHNGIPDGPPVVHLKGFGIEDTHALANNLRFGPDGWIYGAQGSTCIGNVSSSVSKNVHFDGQAIWRYHPQTHVFEVFAEGGGNTFDVEIDRKGRLYSGDNGVSRGQYYKQGGYFVKNLGKHGDYTNPYAFGHLNNMALEGEETRFTHAFIKYSGGSLPARYNDRMIAINPLQSYVQLTRFEQNGSTFKNIDEEKIMTTADHWFRPVDITSGPDGAVYIADWYDSRISHVDPRDTWEKNSGRIYRLRNKIAEHSPKHFDISKSSNDELIKMLSHENIWFSQQALIVLGDRKNTSLYPKLVSMLNDADGQKSLEALWAIYVSGGWNDSIAAIGIRHKDPFVRLWAIRLSGDNNNLSAATAQLIANQALTESNAEVRSQLAATAKKINGSYSIGIIKNLLSGDDSSDPDIPLQLWWAVESHAESNRKEEVELFADKKIWSNHVVSKTILGRLMQRYIIAGDTENYSACARLFALAPSDEYARILFNGLQEGLRGRDVTELSPALLNAMKRYKNLFKDESLAIDVRLGKKDAVQKALKTITDENAALALRLNYIKVFGETSHDEAVPVLLTLAGSSPSGAIKQAALLALQNYNNNEIGELVVKSYPDRLRGDYDVRESALSLFASREHWALQMLHAITDTHSIDKNDVPEHIVRQLKLFDNNEIRKSTEHIWPGIRNATAEEKNTMISTAAKSVSTAGDPVSGHPVFIAKCGTCHKLFGEGRNIAPDLTGYDRKNMNDLLTNIVDPSAYIREGYGTWQVITNDGRLVVGTLKPGTEKSVSIQPFTGDPVTISKDRIKKMEQMKTSMMPERLLSDLTEKQLRDLMTYIRSNAIN